MEAYGVSAKSAAELLELTNYVGIPVGELLVTGDDILAIADDKDIKGSTFWRLRAKVSKRYKKALKVQWTQVPIADGYEIYGSRCNAGGKVYKPKLLKTIDRNYKLAWNHKKLKTKTYYKYIVRAYKVVDGKKITLAVSKVVHAPTLESKYTVAKSVKSDLTTKSVSLKVGETYRLTGIEVNQEADKKIKHHRGVRYESEDAGIAKVSKKGGNIRGIKAGTTYIYAYSQNGTSKKVKVTVK